MSKVACAANMADAAKREKIAAARKKVNVTNMKLYCCSLKARNVCLQYKKLDVLLMSLRLRFEKQKR